MDHASHKDLLAHKCEACGAAKGKPCIALAGQEKRFRSGEHYHAARADALQSQEAKRIRGER